MGRFGISALRVIMLGTTAFGGTAFARSQTPMTSAGGQPGEKVEVQPTTPSPQLPSAPAAEGPAPARSEDQAPAATSFPDPATGPAKASAPGAQIDPAVSQSEDTRKLGETPGGQEIVVTGTKASLGRALDVKRTTLGIVDSISAEGIGKFPDRNVAESLQRIPGVSIDRSAGEGRFITVRGFGPQFNTVLLNGRLLATDNAGREFSFDILPSELISGADVYKSSAANFQEGGIGSTVVIRTARPTDRAGFIAAGQVGGLYDSGSKNVTPIGSVLVSKSNSDRTFGILGSFTYYKRDAVLKRYSTDGWLVGQNLDYNKDGVIDLANVAVPRTSGQLNDRNTRERIGGTVAVDWKPTDTVMLTLDGLYTQYKIHSIVNQLGFFSDPADIIAATINQNRTVTQFTRGNAGSLATDNVVSGAPRDARTYQIAGNARWTPTDRDAISLDVSYSKARTRARGARPSTCSARATPA